MRVKNGVQFCCLPTGCGLWFVLDWSGFGCVSWAGRESGLGKSGNKMFRYLVIISYKIGDDRRVTGGLVYAAECFFRDWATANLLFFLFSGTSSHITNCTAFIKKKLVFLFFIFFSQPLR